MVSGLALHLNVINESDRGAGGDGVGGWRKRVDNAVHGAAALPQFLLHNRVCGEQKHIMYYVDSCYVASGSKKKTKRKTTTTTTI